MEYTVIVNSDSSELDNLVNQRIKDGWMPLGGVSVAMSVTTDDDFFVFAQAMVKGVRPEMVAEVERPMLDEIYIEYFMGRPTNASK